MPAFAARGWEQATIPLVLWTTLRRLGNLANSTGPGGYNEGARSGIV